MNGHRRGTVLGLLYYAAAAAVGGLAGWALFVLAGAR